MDILSKVDRGVIKKVNINDKNSDFDFWQNQPYEYRLQTLEDIREEYNRWKYGTEQGFQRVYSIRSDE